MPTPRSLLAGLLLALSLAGCVERKFLIRSEPPGVEVRVNGLSAGRTPVEIPFVHYGVVRLDTDALDLDGDGFPEYEGMSMPFDLAAPWYQWFPLDFFSDNLWPAVITDRHGAVLFLRPALSPLTGQDDQALKDEIPGLRIRAERDRTEQEAAPPEPGK